MSQFKMFVTKVENPSEFYVRLVELQEGFPENEEEFQRALQEFALGSEMPIEVKKNHLYLTKNMHNQQWCRVEVKEILKNLRFKVFFVDHGKSKVLMKDELKRCCPLFSIVGENMKCSLFIGKEENQVLENSDVNFLFKCIVSKKQTFSMIVHDVVNQTLIVDLISSDRVHNYSVADVLMSVIGISKAPSVLTKFQPLPTVHIKDKSQVKVTHVNSPSDFYVQLVSLGQVEALLRKEMKQFYENNPVYFTLLTEGGLCAFQDVNGYWHRAEVLEAPNKSGLTMVKLVDSGNVSLIAWSELFELSEQFCYSPKCALPCSLAGVKPLDSEWTSECIEFFKRFFAQNGGQFAICPSDDGVLLSILYDGIEININKFLLHMRYAKQTNKISRDFTNIVEISQPANEVLHPVQIVSNRFNPSKFRVKFIKYSGAIDKISESIEKQLVEENRTWVAGDKCVVPYIVDADKCEKWHRGRILEIKKATEEGIKAVVTLIDHGLLVEIWINKLHKPPQEFIGIEDTVNFVKLACQKRSLNEFEDKKMQSIIKSFTIFHITFKDNNNILFATCIEPRPVILWGSVAGEAKQNVICELEANGLVESTYKEQPLVPKGREDWTIRDFILEEKEAPNAQGIFSKSYPLDGRTINIDEYTVTMEKQIILNWLPPVVSAKTSFIGVATNIERNGNIILHDACNNDLLNTITNIINEYFNQPSSRKHHFKVGDPCSVCFENDGLYYRGQILSLNGDSCEVEFIDFGNIQKCKTRVLNRYVICSEIPPLAQRYRLEGSPMSMNGQIDQDLLDILHSLVVDKNITVRVIPDDFDIEDTNYVKRCSISFERLEIRNYDEILSKIVGNL